MATVLSPKALSRSKVELFIECPRCFWLDVRAKIKRPPQLPFAFNNAVDALLKREFDEHRCAGTFPAYLERPRDGIVPARHPRLEDWRESFLGVRFWIPKSGMEFFGAIDDLWVDPQGTYYVVDYKATSKDASLELYPAYRR